MAEADGNRAGPTYEEWLADRSDDRTRELCSRESRSGHIINEEDHADRSAAEAIRAIDIADQHVDARFSGEDPDLNRVLGLFVAAFILWGRR